MKMRVCEENQFSSCFGGDSPIDPLSLLKPVSRQVFLINPFNEGAYKSRKDRGD